MTATSTELLQQGSRGDAVKQLQQRLTMIGYKVDADGIFGPATEEAVKNFQTASGLDTDGIVGPRTHDALFPPIKVDAGDRLTADYRGMQAIARLIQFNGRGRYVLGAGGVNPQSATPFTWVGAQNGCDCIGAVMWGLGCPRHHTAFPEYEGDINCDSAMMDAGLIKLDGGKGLKRFFKPVDRKDVVPGTIVVYRSIRAKELWPGHEADHGYTPNKRVRIGHVALIAGWQGLQDPFQLNATPWDGKLENLVTIECRSAWPAVRMGRNVSFLDSRTHYKKGAQEWTNDDWGVRFMTYVGP